MKLLRIAAVICVVLIAAAGAGLWTVTQPYAGFSGEKLIDIPRGTTTRQMAELLAREGVVRSAWLFQAMRAVQPRTRLQAGEYKFVGPAPVHVVFDRIARGDVFYHELKIPEGSNVFEIARAVEATGLVGYDQFLAAAMDPATIRDLDRDAPSLEGYLFPSTYRITRHTTPAQICRQMTDEFRRVWRELRASGDPHDTVTLASLVEKETAVDEERALVASVFRNRLEQKMNLACDPTTIYAALLEHRYDGVINQSDLASRNRYNTYQHVGLPPGPIANPGLPSLRAALHPAETGHLYFVAKPEGGAHQFSNTSAEHQRAVAQYRRGNKRVQTKPTGVVAGTGKPGRG